jgi:hypothetical protein
MLRKSLANLASPILNCSTSALLQTIGSSCSSDAWLRAWRIARAPREVDTRFLSLVRAELLDDAGASSDEVELTELLSIDESTLLGASSSDGESSTLSGALESFGVPGIAVAAAVLRERGESGRLRLGFSLALVFGVEVGV